MTTIHSAIRTTRFGVAASLLSVGLLIGSVRPGSAGELAAPASTAPVEQAWPLLGTAGFGWG